MSCSLLNQGSAPDLLAIYAPVGGGHRSAAEAVCEAACNQGYRAETLDAFASAPAWYRDLYLSMHFSGQGSAPGLYGAIYAAADRRAAAFGAIRRSFEVAIFAALGKRVRELNAKHVLATHHLPLVALAKDRRAGDLHALGAVVTDYTAHAFWAEPDVDMYFVGAERATRDLTSCGVARDRVVLTGIPTQARFESVSPYRAPLEGEDIRVLITSGGFGIGPFAKVLASLRGVSNTQLRVICGKDAALRARISEQVRSLGLNGEVFGFETDMAAHVSWAHVVVGKAGGLTVTETLVAGRPMVVSGAVPGNEKVNETFVVESGAGVAACPEQVGATILGLRERSAFQGQAAAARATVQHCAAQSIVLRFMAGSGLLASSAA